MHDLNWRLIGQRLKEIRTSKGFTQEYLANIVDINTSHISNIENSRVKISLPTLVKICNALEITVDYVLANEYTGNHSALDNEILKELHNCDNIKKEKFLQIIKIL